MIFDYSAVFTDKAFSEIKFVYMPGAWTAQKPGCCGELIKIVFLHMYGELPAEEYRLMGHAIDTLCVETEYDGLLCGIRNLRLRLQQYNLNKKTSFYNKLCELVKKTVASVREGEADEKEDGKIVSRNKKCSDPGESLERCLCTERYVELIGEEKLEGSYVRKNFKKERRVFIKIGRDKEWSDLVVNDIFASRRHAELQIDRDGYMSINDMSLNGVGISGDKKSPDNEISIINSDIKIFITENCRVLVRYKTGTA